MAFDGGELRLDWDGIPVAAMDCATDNLAVLLRFHGAADVLSPFGCEWHLGAGAAGALLLDRLPVEDLVRRLTGFELRSETPAADAPAAEALATAIADHLSADRPVLLYADAYYLPWLPYFGTAHMDHTFLVTGVSADGRTYAVTDAYDNPTQWGHATPVRTYVDGFGLVRAVAALADLGSPYAGRLVTLDRAGDAAAPDWTPLLAENARELAAATDAGVLSAYADHYRDRLDDAKAVAEVTLACWLVQRRRALHAAWLATLDPALLPDGFAAEFEAEVAGGWRRARDFAYLAQRRAEQGRRAPATTLDLLATTVEPAEAAAAKRLAEHVGAGE